MMRSSIGVPVKTSSVSEGSTEPLFPAVTVTLMPSTHFAYSVTSAVTALASKSQASPEKSGLAYQPAKMYPARVGSSGFVAFSSDTTSCASTVEPPFESNNTVNCSCISHFLWPGGLRVCSQNELSARLGEGDAACALV